MPRRVRRESTRYTGSPTPPSRWIITYTDLCTLLLTFFVLLVSMSTIDDKRQRRALDSLGGTFGAAASSRSTSSSRAPAPADGLDLGKLAELGRRSGLNEDPIRDAQGRLLIRLGCRALGDAEEISPPAREYLSALAAHLKAHEVEVEIRGHTDGAHPALQPERSWQVSTRWAQVVYNALRDQGVSPGRMSAHGFSSTRPLPPDRMSEGDRRVEIVLGPTHTIPSRPSRERRQASPYFNYKNFFFNLYPSTDPPHGAPREEGDRNADERLPGA